MDDLKINDFNDPEALYGVVEMSMMKWGAVEYKIIKLDYNVNYDFYLPYIWMEMMEAYPLIYWGSILDENNDNISK